MNTIENVYHKCGEIYLANEKKYTFLCYYCNELFYKFADFETHSLIHINSLDFESDVLDSRPNNSKLEEHCEAIDIDIVENNLKQCTELKCKELINDINFKEDYENNIDSKSSLYPTKNESIQELNEENIIQKTTEVTYCSHCKTNVENGLHDIKKCFIQKMKSKYNADFIKMLRRGVLCCFYCHKYFEDYKNLYDHHIKLKHCFSNEQCIICKFYKFMSSKVNSSQEDSNILNKDDDQYENIVEENYQTRCKECSIDFNSKMEYDIHCKNNHNDKEDKDDMMMGNEIEQNDSDEDNFSDTVENINVSKDDDTPTPCEENVFKYKCCFCDRVFRKNAQKKIHMRIHTNNRPYKCSKCPSAFTVSANLKTHIIYKHTDDRPFKCEYEGCGANFKLFYLKKQHEKTHLPSNFQCEICGHDYKSKFNLLKHQQSRHVDAKNWTCECEICHKRFANTENLANHKRIHTGEKPYGCDKCPKFFRRRNALREHKRLHSDERKHVCLICGKGFKQRAGYWGHMKRHPIIS